MPNSPGKVLSKKPLPNHVAIIMDGNGRWAQQKGLPRTEGHRQGANRLKSIIHVCLDLGIRYLTVYAFSKENWKRPVTEIDGIMRLAEFFFKREFDRLKEEGVYFSHFGEIEGLPSNIQRIINEMKRNNAEEKRLYFNIAFNYSGRNELVRAVKEITRRVVEGKLEMDEICEEKIQEFLYSARMPDPDLLIRTGGQLRVSNFLLWQIAYSEIWVTDVLWPDFTPDIFIRAVEDFSGRERRFGGIRT